jgi:hypothetical protein
MKARWLVAALCLAVLIGGAFLYIAVPPSGAYAKGEYEYDREWLVNDIKNADLVAVGTLSGVWTYPWRDGFHRRGTLNVEKVLFQSHSFGTAVPLTWGRLYWHRFYYPDLKKYERQKGIWILKEYSTTWDDRMDVPWCGNSTESVVETRIRLKAPWTIGFAGGFLTFSDEQEIAALIGQLRQH